MSETQRLTLAEIRRLDADTEARAAQAPGRLKAGVTSPNGTAVAGCDGMLFIADGTNRWERHYLGHVDIDQPWFTAWRDVLLARQAEARRRGVILWNMVVPEKQVLLPEARWPAPLPSGDRRPFRRLLDQLAGDLPACNLYYPVDDLTRAKAEGPIYFRLNSHWCPAGCCEAAIGLLRAIGVQADFEGTPLAYARTWNAHDLPPHFFADPPQVELGLLRANGPYTFENRLLETAGRFTGNKYGIRNPDAPDKRRLLIFGDSFSYDAGLAFALSGFFAETIFEWSKDVRWELVESYGADVVLWESAERFMATVPAS